MRGFVDSMARNAERRILPVVLNTRKSPGELKPGVLHAFLRDLGVAEMRRRRRIDSGELRRICLSNQVHGGVGLNLIR